MTLLTASLSSRSEPSMNSMQTVIKQHHRRDKLVSSGLRIGAHFGPGGKHCLSALAQALEAPATAMQIFGGGPKGYWCSNVAPEDVETFRDTVQAARMYVAVHAVYITNIAAHPDLDGRSRAMTMHCISNHMLWANRMGANSVVLHSGSAKTNDKEESIGYAIECLREALYEYDVKADEEGLDTTKVRLLVENCAGDKNNQKLGGEDIFELATLIEEVKDPRLGIVIDTTHAFAAGYTIPKMIETLNDERIQPNLDLLHFNQPDTSVKCGSHLDRHSSLFTDGAFSLKELCTIYTAFRHLPLICEGSPHIASDLAHMLRWEIDIRDGQIPAVMNQIDPDDIFSLGAATE
jgi:endonuclease IV